METTCNLKESGYSQSYVGLRMPFFFFFFLYSFISVCSRGTYLTACQVLGSLGVTIISILVAFNFDYLGKLGNLPRDIKRWLRWTPDIQDLTPDMQRLLSPEMRHSRKKVEELRQFRNKPHDEENGGYISPSKELHTNKDSHD